MAAPHEPNPEQATERPMTTATLRAHFAASFGLTWGPQLAQQEDTP